ncbi:MAG: shikimate dehydrogenase, partial [Verrucomicrobia bacterium]|nr:shikimate dehydrogenase [Verrucomicrobiota bacterium]
HDYEKTPSDLTALLQELQTVEADFYKIACMAHSAIDSLRLLAFAKTAPKNCLLMTMGDTGYITRILSPVVGRPFTYACEEVPLVPGQLPYNVLEDMYGYSSLNTSTNIYGLIGYPVEKSISHVSHNRVMQQHNLSSVYVKMPVKPEEFEQFFPLARTLGVRGLSVTTPLKEAVMAYCTTITPEALAIGAVNTLRFDDKGIHGSNTDGPGACAAIEKHVTLKGSRVVVLGAGGAAKAIAWQAHALGADVTICNRDRVKGHALAEKIGCRAGEPNFAYDIIINSTSSGMPIDASLILPGSFAMDVRTIPMDTEFLIEAKKRGCHPIYGYEMFIEQAILQYKTWFHDLDVSDSLTKAVLGYVGSAS